MRRLYARNYLMHNVYQGVSEPIDLLNKKNPDHEKTIEELTFSSELFFMMDKDLPKNLKNED